MYLSANGRAVGVTDQAYRNGIDKFFFRRLGHRDLRRQLEEPLCKRRLVMEVVPGLMDPDQPVTCPDNDVVALDCGKQPKQSQLGEEFLRGDVPLALAFSAVAGMAANQL